MIPRQLDKYTNYNGYYVGGRGAHPVDELTLCKVIGALRETHKSPYIRFMWSNHDTAMCVVYSNSKKNERMTKLVPFNEVAKQFNVK